MSLRSGLALVVAALAWSSGAAQVPNCTAPNVCFWVDDDTCGRCYAPKCDDGTTECFDNADCTGIGGGTCDLVSASAITCTSDADCAGVGIGQCGGVCANDRDVACFFDSECVDAGVGGVCDLTPFGNGSQADPYCRIQDAYFAAITAGVPTSPANPYIIPVQPGTYSECVTAWGFGDSDPLDGIWEASNDWPVKLQAVDFLVNGNAATTVIDGTGTCDPLAQAPGAPDSVVKIGGTGAAIQGFTITGGARSGVFAQGEVAITNNVIHGNRGELGGGIYLLTASCYYGANIDAVIADNTIEDNVSAAPLATSDPNCSLCLSTASCGTGDGGGIFAAIDDRDGCGGTDNQTNNVEISGNTIRNNTAENLNLDPCTAICEGNPDALAPGICASPGQSCPAGTEPCVPQIAYTANGAGLFVLTDSFLGVSAVAAITQNLISGNVMTATSPEEFSEGYGGGIYAVTFGSGADTIEIGENCIGGQALGNCTAAAGTGNSATLDGGGISARVRPLVNGRHAIDIHDNTVIDNDAGRDAGGMELLTEVIELGSGAANDFARLTVTDNLVADNESGRDGGGVKAVADVRRTTSADAEELTLALRGNTISGNTSGLGAGGALLIPIGDADDFSGGDCLPNAAPSESRIDVVRNLIVDNVAAADDPDVDVIGGGILALPLTYGDATASVVIDQTTVAGNSIGQFGFVGGIEAQAVTYEDCLLTDQFGTSFVSIDRTIVANNTCPDSPQCIGVGGPPLGDSVLIANAASSNVFGHSPNYETPLYPGNPPPGNITGNPLLDAGTYFPDACSPVFERFCHGSLTACSADGDCGKFCSVQSSNALDPCADDLGCPGGTCLQRCVDAVGYYGNPDATGDGAVDGQEVLAIAAAFGASTGDARYDAPSDINRNGQNDGDDLSFLTSEFGQVCEP